MTRFKVEKLVRDRTVERHEADQACTIVARSLSLKAYRKALREKIVEEAYEVAQAEEIIEIATELADVFEVARALAQAYGISLELIEEIRLSKSAERGAFKKRLYCEYADAKEGSRHYDLYKKAPEKYPQIKD
jgi:predicted house-cleaning noncanonical NTP pyrophosphatase (MazG superfamily)